MPRKPKEGCHEIHVSHNGAAVRVTLFPPRAVKKERTWFAYW